MTNLEGLDAEQLKERLLVAETIMKKLYVRNKELEDYHSRSENIKDSDLQPSVQARAEQSKHNQLSDQIRYDLLRTQSEVEGNDSEAINALDNIETTLSKIDDNMERFVVNFRKREVVLEDEIASKDE